jgi:hypothetical protein
VPILVSHDALSVARDVDSSRRTFFYRSVGARHRVFQYVPQSVSGESRCPARHRRAIPQLSEEPIRQLGRAPPLDAPLEARNKFVEPYFRHAKHDRVVAILKAREPARRLIAIGKKAENLWHLKFAQRWVDQYNFYVNDAAWGRMSVRVCPPFCSRRASLSIGIVG